jgi:hypothetical protein
MHELQSWEGGKDRRRRDFWGWDLEGAVSFLDLPQRSRGNRGGIGGFSGDYWLDCAENGLYVKP